MATIHDQVFKKTITRHGDKLQAVLEQPDQGVILEENAELRKNPGAIDDLSFGRWVGSIPMIDYEILCKKYPELIKGDGAQRQACLMKILNSSAGKKYLVQPKKENRIVV